MRECEVPGCVNTHLARGLCQLHYWRWRRHGTPYWTPPEPPGLDRIHAEMTAALEALRRHVNEQPDSCARDEGGQPPVGRRTDR